MKRIFTVLLAALPVIAVSGELETAREALRDGLWKVARIHASNCEGETAEDLAIESFAREGNWDGLLAALDAMGNPDRDSLAYYRALALMENGKTYKAGYQLSGRKFSDPVYNSLARRLRVRIAMAEGDSAEALKIVGESGASEVDIESRMLAAQLLSVTGDRQGAENVWREVIALGTNAGERVFAVASVNLGDEKPLRLAYATVKSPSLRRLVGLALGSALLSDKATLDEGARIIRAIVKADPDDPAAKAVYPLIADAYLAAGRDAEAADVFHETVEMWPDAAKSFAVNEGSGWALAKLGRRADALAAFVRAEECATNIEDKAVALVKQGDVLSEDGKVEDAVKCYRRVVEKYPDTPSAATISALVKLRERESKGRELYREYRFEDAQKLFAEIGREAPDRKARMDYLIVLCLYGQGLDDEAERQARELSLVSGDPKVRALATLWLAKFSYNRGKWTDSRELFTSYVALAPEADDAGEALLWAARAAFADNDYKLAIQLISNLANKYPTSTALSRGYLVQGESLIELARFDEAVLVFERVIIADSSTGDERMSASILKADALFAMGADNAQRYQEALDAYRGVRLGESLNPSAKLSVSFKIAKTLEKLKRTDEAVDRYYTDVVLAYREGRQNGIRFDDDARANFSRAAFRLADEFESRGKDFQAMHILELVVASDVPAADEAEKRIERIQRKGNFL